MMKFLKMLWHDEAGQDLAEYAILIGLIAIVVIGTITLLGTNLNTIFTTLATAMTGIAGGS